MEEEFDDGSRWDVLRDFLLERAQRPDRRSAGAGALRARAVLGGLGRHEPDPDRRVPDGRRPSRPRLDNFAAIAEVYRDAEPIEDTPTGDSIDRVLEVARLHRSRRDATTRSCSCSRPTASPIAARSSIRRTARQRRSPRSRARIRAGSARTSSASATRSASSTSRTWRTRASAASPGDPDAEYWRAGDDQSLRAALTSIVGGQLGCEIAAQRPGARGQRLHGSVKLNGDAARLRRRRTAGSCSTRSTIRLLGTACDELKASDDVYLDVSFPCDVVGPV